MERLEDYALRIIGLYGALPDYPAPGHQVAQVLGKQLLRSGTSIGANYAEAIRTHSLADKAAKQQICIKELEETAYWLRLLSKTGLLAPSGWSHCWQKRVRSQPSLSPASENFSEKRNPEPIGYRLSVIGYRLSAIARPAGHVARREHSVWCAA